MLNFINTAWAQGVDLLAPLPEQAANQNIDFGTYLAGAFPLFIRVIILIAVAAIAWGGIEYMFSRVPGIKTDAKRRILYALGGLILALSAWLLLHTLNPQITSTDLQQVLDETSQ